VSKKKPNRQQGSLQRSPARPPTAQPLPGQLQAMLERTEFTLSQEITRQVPDPAEMAQYDSLVPGSAARFIAEWAADKANERDLALIQAEAIREEIRAAAKDRRTGLWMGFLLGGGGLTGLVLMGLQGASWVGMGAVVLAISSLVWSVRRSTTTPQEPPSEQTAEDQE
jgi:uncharacterized membrane protein